MFITKVDIKPLRKLLKIAVRLYAEATRCSAFSNKWLKDLNDEDENNQDENKPDKIPNHVVALLCRDAAKWKTKVHISEDKRTLYKVAPEERNEFSEAVFASMYNKPPPYPNMEGVGDIEVKVPDETSSDPLGKKFHSVSCDKTFSFLPFVLAMPAGFEQRGDGADAEFEYWPGGQPRVARQVSQERMVTSSPAQNGVIDLLTGKCKKEDDLAVELGRLQAQGTHVSLFGLEGSTAEEESADCISIESALLPLESGGDHRHGVFQLDGRLRKCRFEDMDDAFHLVTNRRFADVYTGDLEAKSDEEKCLLCFVGLEKAFESYGLGELEGWINLYHVLHYRAGMPQLTEKNREEHKFLLPRSWPELLDRIILFFLAKVNFRCAADNGLLRVASLRYAMMGIMPSRKPILLYREKRLAPIWASGMGEDSPVQQGLIHCLRKKVKTTVCLGEATSANVADLWKHSQEVRNTEDHAQRKDAREVWMQGREFRKDHIAFLHANAKRKTDNALVAKPLEIKTQQARLVVLQSLFQDRNSVVVENTGAEIGDFIDAVATGEKYEAIRKTMAKDPFDTEKSNEKGLEAVNENQDFIDTHWGCEGVSIPMLSPRWKNKIVLDKEKLLGKLLENLPEVVAIIFALNHAGRSWSWLLNSRGVNAGNLPIPPVIHLAAIFAFLMYDDESLLICECYVQNNGTGIEAPRNGFAMVPKEDSAASSLTKVSLWPD